MLVSQLLSPLSFDDFVMLVALVGYEDFGDIVVSMLLNLFQPVLDVVKGLLFGAVVDQDYAHGAFVIGLGDGSESLLSSCVPNLKLYPLLVHIYGLDFEIYPYRKNYIPKF